VNAETSFLTKIHATRDVPTRWFMRLRRMAHLKYLIVSDQGQWKINHDGQVFGNYQSEQQAISRAMEAAFSSAMSGHKAEVVTQGRLGELKVVCVYGRDGQQARR
jgi:hypothetical protein